MDILMVLVSLSMLTTILVESTFLKILFSVLTILSGVIYILTLEKKQKKIF